MDAYKVKDLPTGSLLQREDSEDVFTDPGRSCTVCTHVPKFKVFRTAVTYMTFFGVGLATSILGASLIQIEDQTASSSRHISLLFTWRGVGCIIGNIVVGAVCDRVKPEVLLGASTGLLGLMLLLTPWCSNYYTVAMVVTGQGVSIGSISAGAHTLCLLLWPHKTVPIIQALHFSVSAGASLAPLLLYPFRSYKCANINSNIMCYLQSNTSTGNNIFTNHDEDMGFAAVNTDLVDDLNSDLNYHIETNDTKTEPGILVKMYEDVATKMLYTVNDTDVYSHSESESELSVNMLEDLPSNIVNTVGLNGSAVYTHTGFIPQVLFSQSVIGVYVCFMFVLHMVIIVRQLRQSARRRRESELGLRNDKELEVEIEMKSNYDVPLICLIFTFSVLASGLEGTYGGLILSFVVRHLNWTPSNGALIMTVFWISFAAGRCLGVLWAHCLKPCVIVFIDIITVTVTLTIMLSFSHKSDAILWGTSIVLGLSLSTSFAPILGYAQSSMKLCGRISSLFIAGFYVGFMTIPSVTGVLCSEFGYEWFIYVCLIDAGAALCVLCVIRLRTRCK